MLMLVLGACGGDAAESTTTVATVASTPSSTLAAVDGVLLAEPGPYGVGRAEFETTDASRDDRRVRMVAFYPAMTESDRPDPDAAADAAGAPYPVIVGDGNIGDALGPHLASHGFVFTAVQGQYTWGMSFNTNMIDFPLDHMVALDALEALVDGPVAGLADTDRAGTTGYSFGGWDALMLTGARIDPDHYRQTCASRPDGWSDTWWVYICGSEERWTRVVERAEEVGIATGEGLWAPMGDERIKAAMPMAAEGFDMTGPDGLAGATAAVLLVGASADDINDYNPATTRLFANYPGAELLTFVGADHMMARQPDVVSQIKRFAAAFFGYHLAGEDGYDRFLTEEFVEDVAPGLGEANAFETLVWGVTEP
jgi:predicted dienelactone hydrolase